MILLEVMKPRKRQNYLYMNDVSLRALKAVTKFFVMRGKGASMGDMSL